MTILLDPELSLAMSRDRGAELRADAHRHRVARQLARAGPAPARWWRRLAGLRPVPTSADRAVVRARRTPAASR